MIKNDKEEIRKTYEACKESFEEKEINNFVMKHLTYDNLKVVGGLSGKLRMKCGQYYQEHRKKIREDEFFKQT